MRLLLPNLGSIIAALMALSFMVSSPQISAAQQLASPIADVSVIDDTLAADPSVEADPAADSAPAIWDPLLEINYLRGLAGVPPAKVYPALAASAAGQVNYYDINRGDPSLAGMGLHQQRPGAPGFTGTSIGARAKAAGYSSGAVTENAGFGGLHATLDWAINTVNHRLPLIHPNAIDVGFAASDSSSFTIVDVGLARTKITSQLPSVFPGDGWDGVPTSWDGSETPDPAPGVRRPLGYPITVAFSVQQKVEWGLLQLTGPDGQPLEISTPRTDWMGAVAIIPLRPLQNGETYTAHVEAKVDGKPVVKEWSFATFGRPSTPPVSERPRLVFTLGD